MIYAVKHNKVNRGIYKANEDALTSSIFERFSYLPQELLQQIFCTALFDQVDNLNLDRIESIHFWPNWSAEDTTNSNRVEPDIFIRTPKQDIIIEAKRYDVKQQSKYQWKNEIQAYFNEYAEDAKELIFIALGGLHNIETELLKVNEIEHPIYKCTWKAILNAVQHIIYDMELAIDYTNSNKAIVNILTDIVLCFELFGFSTSPWLERFIKAPQIQQQSIKHFSKLWTN